MHRARNHERNPRFRRRAFLGGLGAGAGLLPFLPLLAAEAGGQGEFPLRLILLFSANGTLHENWAPTGSETDFTLSPILAPLAPYQDQMIVLDGLSVSRAGPGDDHQKGMGSLWTGSPLLVGEFTGGNGELAGYADGISVDQHVANSVGAQSLYKSLEFGVQTGGANVWTRMSYAGSNQPLAPEDSPAAMFDRLFAELDVDPAQIEKLKAERRSVIDLVKEDLSALEGKYGSDDKVKIEAHLDAIREIEMRNEAAVPSCDKPVLDLDVDQYANDQFPTLSHLQMDQLVMALACDMTRVASLQWSASVSNVLFSWLGVGEGHHDLSHYGDGDQNMIDNITTINTWYAGEVKYLLDAMAAVPEGDGTLLDHSLVVWGNELSRGNSHGNNPVPFVLFGGANGAWPTGRYLQYDGTLHNRLLVSLCRAMGVVQDTFGGNDDSTGGLQGLL
jgi:hypothetical protein